MAKEDEIKLIWWLAIETARIMKRLKENKYRHIESRIIDFQYELWKICGGPTGKKPKLYGHNYWK